MSDEEVAESEDEGMVGCLGFVSSQSDSPIKHRSRSEARKTMRQSKSDITKATPGKRKHTLSGSYVFALIPFNFRLVKSLPRLLLKFILLE